MPYWLVNMTKIAWDGMIVWVLNRWFGLRQQSR